MTTNARIKIYVKGKPVQSFCQTQNLSATGVLIRGFSHYPPGSKIDFEISLPTDTAPIKGRAPSAAAPRGESSGSRAWGSSSPRSTAPISTGWPSFSPPG